jgi:hypothetical protein
MRHISTLIAAVFVAPLSWLLLSFGQDRSAQAFTNAQNNGGFNTTDFVRPLACLAGAGLLLGILATLRVSPLGAMLTGGAYAASYAALLFAPAGVLGLFPHSVYLAGHSADPTTPLRTGTAMVLGALMLVATLSVGRWRRRQAAAESEQPVTAEPAKMWLPANEEADLSRSTSGAEPELASRYTSATRGSGNGRPAAYRLGDNGTDPWRQARQTAWPNG